MNFKDLNSRCVLDMRTKLKTESGLENKNVFYFKPETYLLDDPEKQRAFREKLLKQVGNVPAPDSIKYLGDELHRNMCQTIADRSTPKATKEMLTAYFLRKQY